MDQQSSRWPASSSSSISTSQQLPTPRSSSDIGPDDEGHPYDNPVNLLSIYPFATYQPIARTAEHIAPHTVTYPPQASSSDLYPQHAGYFQSIDNPKTPDDLAMRKETEDRVRVMMASKPSYSESYLPTPSPTGDPASFLAYPSSGPIPMPYSFVGNYLPSPSSTVHQSPTPDGPQTPSSAEFMDKFVKDTLAQADEKQAREVKAAQEANEARMRADMKRASSSSSQGRPNGASSSSSGGTVHASATNGQASQPQPQTPSHRSHRESSATSINSHASTPHLSQRMSQAAFIQPSPDPLAMHGPSPPKRQRSYRENSPSIRTAQTFPRVKEGQLGRRKSPEVQIVIPTRKPIPQALLAPLDDDNEDEDLDWGDDARDGDGDWEMKEWSRTPSYNGERSSAMAPASGRTGERDTRDNLQKLQTLLDDLLNESDAFPPDPTSDDLAQSQSFNRFNRDRSSPLLSNETIERLMRYIQRAQSGSKRSRSSNKIEWDVESIGRVSRILERSVRDGEAQVVFPSDIKSSSVSKLKLKGGRKKKNGSKSKSPDEDDKMDGIAVTEAEELSEKELRDGETKLAASQAAGLAAACCMTIMDTPGSPKHILSEDLLLVAVGLIRDLLKDVIIPVVECLAGDKPTSRYLSHLVEAEAFRPKKASGMFHHAHLASIAQSCCLALPHLTSLISRSDISFDEQLVIRTVYLSIASLFVAESAPKKGKAKEVEGNRKAVMKVLVTESLGCLRATFARYEGQRKWIMEEILGAMIKTGEQNASQAKFRLADGSSISTISALLLQLVQSSAFGAKVRIVKLRSTSLESELLAQSHVKDEADTSEEECQICADEIESALKSVRIVTGYLVQRSSAAKSSKASNDQEYKAILDTFVSDLLSVLYRPEWPAASLYLNVISRMMITPLEEGRTGNEAAHARTVALDYLGDIAAKLKTFQLKSLQSSLPTMEEIISSSSLDAAEKLVQGHAKILSHLSHAAKEDVMYNSSLDLETVICGQELYNGLNKIQSLMEKLDAEKTEEASAIETRLQEVSEVLKNPLKKIWTTEVSLFSATSDPITLDAAKAASIGVARGRALQGAFEPILGALMASMGNTAIGVRTKALKGLSRIVSIDPSILSQSSVRQAIENRLEDPSPSVREAAVELIGKYVVQRPQVAADYYEPLVKRIYDTGLGVRKRVIKFLKGIFGSIDRKEIRVDVCCKFVTLVEDLDESIKDLGVKTLCELLYPETPRDPGEAATLLVDMVDQYDGSSATFEKAIREISKLSNTSAQGSRFDATVKALIDNMIDSTEDPDFDSISHIRAIHLLCTAEPNIIDANRAQVMLSYLRPPATKSNPDDQIINEFLLKIFNKCIPSMPKAAQSFVADLQKALTPMISRPSGAYATVRETLACYCASANYLTLDYSGVMRVLRACEAKLRQMRNEWNTQGTTTLCQVPGLPVMLYICALIAEFCDLDETAQIQESVRVELASITEKPLREHLYECFLDFAQMPIEQKATTVCLGSLFKAHPLLILREQSVQWMKTVFASPDPEAHARLLSVIHDFLISEGDRKARGERQTDLTALIGHAESSDSGLSTAVVQRNIDFILQGARSQHAATQDAALNILGFTVNQGLYHPLQCMPILISLETSDNDIVAERALAVHQHLHTKHPTLVNVRFMECARASFDYQRGLTAEVSGQRGGRALLSAWYGMLGEKKAWKTDFLRQLCRAFDYDLAPRTKDKIDDSFALYIAENLAGFEYKLQEEVMIAVHLLSGVISGSALLVNVLESCDIVGEPTERVAGKFLSSGDGEGAETFSAPAVIQASIIVGLAVITKNHLLGLYGIPEDKCVKYQIGKKSALGDKPAIPRSEEVVGMDYGSMSLVRGVSTVQEYQDQKNAFLQLLHEDGTLDDADRE